jgi:DNA mismatch repair protein MutL
MIDVNIHPTKTEIKFQDEKIIYTMLRATVKRSIGTFNLGGTIDFENISPIDFSSIPQKGTPRQPFISTRSDYNPFDSDRQKPTHKDYFSNVKLSKNDENWKKIYESIQENTPIEYIESMQTQIEHTSDAESNVINQPAAFQTLNRYIITRIKSGFVVIETEAAMERILFDRYSCYLSDNPQGTQKLLFPETLTFSLQNSDIVTDLLKEFDNLGFDIEPFGKNTFILNGVPADVLEKNAQEIMEQLLESYKNNLLSLKISKKNNLAHSLARSVGQKKNKILSEEETQLLISELFACESPHISPSGKKICITFNENELNRMFG